MDTTILMVLTRKSFESQIYENAGLIYDDLLFIFCILSKYPSCLKIGSCRNVLVTLH